MSTATITASALSYMNAQWENLADTPSSLRVSL